jgi:hypothetical protein
VTRYFQSSDARRHPAGLTMPGFVNGVLSVPKRNLIRVLGVPLRPKKGKNFVTNHSNVLTWHTPGLIKKKTNTECSKSPHIAI